MSRSDREQPGIYEAAESLGSDALAELALNLRWSFNHAAQTDPQMHADILSWSRIAGVVAGVALKGATLRQDLDDNATLYAKKRENRQIVTAGVRPPKAANELLALLNRYSTKERTRWSCRMS